MWQCVCRHRAVAGLRQRAFTLLELLLSIVLSSLIALGLMKLFSVVSVNHRALQNLAAIQENGRFVSRALVPLFKTPGLQVSAYDYAHAPVYWQRQMVKDTLLLLLESNQETAVFMGDTKRRTARGEKIIALYDKVKGGQRQELVPNVLQFHVELGELQQGRFAWHAAEEVVGKPVVLVKLDWLLASEGRRFKREWEQQYAIQ